MRAQPIRAFSVVSILGALAVLPAAADEVAAPAAPRTPILAKPHMVFFSDFATNLNDALIAAGLAREKSQPELFSAGEEKACLDALAPSRRAGWEAAVGWYAEVVSPAGWMARPQFLLRMELVGFDSEWQEDERAREFVGIARGLRAAADPAYRACRWPAQDQANRRWIAELEPRLAVHEAVLAERIQALYRKRWPKLPLLVDVVETVDWSGANSSWSDEGQGDILVSRTEGGTAALELVFHEASHVLMDRSDPVREALDEAAKAAGVELPGDLWHAVLFFTTGEAVRARLEESGETGYRTMLEEIQARGGWDELREALETAWRPYVAGRRTLPEAATALGAALPAPPKE